MIDMKKPRSGASRLSMVLLVALAAGGNAASSEGFQAMMNDATERMHAAMHVPFTGDADRDFARMMIPHHQGAIDMAMVELRYGKDERLKRLAQEIIVSQKQEIEVMRLVLKEH